jgi:hypothetical protein
MVKQDDAAPGEDVLCHCFGYTRRDIEADCAAHHGHSTILDRITAEIRAGTCDCLHKNPKRR